MYVASTPRSWYGRVVHCCVGREVLCESAEAHSEECSISQELFLPGDTVVGNADWLSDRLACSVSVSLTGHPALRAPVQGRAHRALAAVGYFPFLPHAYISCGQHYPPSVLLCIVECTTLVRFAGKAFCARLTEVDWLDYICKPI